MLIIAVGAVISWHPFMALIAYPEATVALRVQEGDAEFLIKAVRSRYLPRRVRTQALSGVIDLRGTFHLADDAANKLVGEFAGDVPPEALIMLYPPFVDGRINNRLRAILEDESADSKTQFAAFCSLTERPEDRVDHHDQINSLLERVRPGSTRAILSRMWSKLQRREPDTASNQQ